MTRALASWLLLAFVWSGYQTPPLTVRVMTYNIHHGEGTDGEFNLPRLAEVMKSAAPDLIALQEVDVSTERSSGINQLAELARLTGMHAEFGKTMNYEGGDYGVAVLSRWPLLDAEGHPLPDPQDREPRTAFTVRVRIGEGGPLVRFTSTHLDQGRDQDNRLRQAAALNDLLVRDSVPTILAGDMNSRVDSDVMKVLDSEWINASAPAQVPGEPLRRGGDFVLYRPASCWRPVEWRILDEPVASDHRPVLAVLEWTGSC